MRIENWLRQKELRRLSAKKQARQAYPGFEKARTMALFFNYTEVDPHWVAQLKTHFEELGKQVQVLCYFPYRQKEMAPDFAWPYYANDQTNWLQKPGSPHSTKFLEGQYDIFIDLTRNFHPSYLFVREGINAKICINLKGQEAHWADLTIDIDPRDHAASAQGEIEKYLKFINQAS